MLVNYHTHTFRCKHATGTEREYVEAAIQNGFQVLGFSDHTPYPFPNDEEYRQIFMKMEDLEEYADTILRLKEEYRKDIEIHLGLEVEYYPRYFGKLLERVRELPIEYFILGQHALGSGERTEVYSGEKTTEVMRLKRYCDQVIEAMETGSYTYFAHPDVFHFAGDMEVYDREIRRLCRVSKIQKVPLEINFLGIRENRFYPYQAFWKIAGDEGCEVVFGLDAHSPEAFYAQEALAKANALVEQYGLKHTENIVLRRP